MEFYLKILLAISAFCGIGTITGWAGIIALLFKLRAEKRRIYADANKSDAEAGKADADSLKTRADTIVSLIGELESLQERVNKLFENERIKSVEIDNIKAVFRQIETYMREILNYAHVGYWEATADGLRNVFNEAWFDLTGMNFEESCGTGWQKCVHEDDLGKVIRHIDQAWRGSSMRPLKFRIVNQSSKEIINVESMIYVVFNLDGSVHKIIGRKVKI